MTSHVTAQQWIQTRDNQTGRQLAVAVPSQSTPNLWHLVTLAGCDCRGFSFRQTCKHFRAVQAEIAARAATVTSAPQRAVAAPVSGEHTFYTAAGFGGTIRPNGTERARLSALAGDIWGTDGEGS